MDANPVNIYEYEEIAKGKLGRGEYDWFCRKVAFSRVWQSVSH